MIPSSTYQLIWRAARTKLQLVFVYQGHPRETCPLILGYDDNGDERLFTYQFGGTTSKGPSALPQWRCLKLSDLQDLQLRAGPWYEGDSHRQTQSCIRFVDIDVNVPESLTHKKPLPYGSPQLRALRRS